MNYGGMCHLSGMILEDVYGFIVDKHVLLDKLYLMSFVAIPFSWLLCKDECLISYLMKKINRSSYVLGSEPDNVHDISDLFPKNTYFIFFHLNHVVRIFSVNLVNQRSSRIPNVLMIPTYVVYLGYTYDITYQLDYRKKYAPYFQMIVFFFLCTTGYLTTVL